MTINKLTIGLVFGGKSSEHEISIKSAKTIYSALNSQDNQRDFITIPIFKH